MNIPRDFPLLKNQILSKEFFWVLGFFSAEGSVILEKTKQSFRLVFDISQKCTLEKKDRLTELLAPYGFVFSFWTKKGVSHWRIRKKEEAYLFSILLLTYGKWLCPKKREKLEASLQCLNCALLYSSQSLGCEEQCYWALGVWEGDGGVSISYHKKQATIKTLQIRTVQKLEPNSTSLFPQLLVLFQQVLTNRFTTNQNSLGILEIHDKTSNSYRWRTRNRSEVLVFYQFLKNYSPYIRTETFLILEQVLAVKPLD